MSDLEDLNAKAARLWLEFMQAQAKAAAAAAQKLPEVTRSMAEAGVPLAAEVSRWIEGALPAAAPSADRLPKQAGHVEEPRPAAIVTPAPTPRRASPLTRVNHRRLKTPKSMARRRARRV